MKRVTLFCGLLAMLGTGAVLWQQHSLSNFRHGQENGFLSETATNWEDGALQSEIITLREQTRDLPKLRNEVSQLRARRAELAAAHTENVRLLEVKTTGAALPREVPLGFTSKEQLKNAGYATPESAVETFFWAMREGNLALVMQALSPENGEREDYEGLPPGKRQQEEDNFRTEGKSRTMNRFNDFKVTRQEQLSEDTVALHLRSSVATNTSRFQLKRFGTEWKLTDLHR
jgi:hypothetical protein